MSDEDIIKWWNLGLCKNAVVNQYMKAHNRKAKNNKEIKRITKEQAMRYVEPILFEYEMQRIKSR